MINNRLFTIALVAGETSGDILGAGLMRALKNRVRNIRFVGVAGPLMQKEGCETWYEIAELSIMGVIEIFSHLNRLLCIRSDLIRRFSKLKPDVFIGIDSPDFNITLEGNLKEKGIKTIHYISPSIWAWRQRRIFKISKSTNLVLVAFPFEKIFYDKFNIPCRFIGHTMADSIPLNPKKNEARNTLNITHNARCLVLLPGSRSKEVKMLSAAFLKASKILRQIYPYLELIVPLVNTKLRRQFECIKDHVAPDLQMRLFNGKSLEAIIASDAALLACGTAALECMFAKCPMVVGYRMNPITFWILKRLVKIDYVSLPNLLAGRQLVTELLQEECHPKAIVNALLPLLENRKSNQKTRKIFLDLHQKIRCNADEKAADAVLELIGLNIS